MIYKGLLILSWIYIVFGIIGLFRFHNIYTRFLVSSKIDTVAFITIIFAIMIRTGFELITLKLFVVLFFFMISNPVSTHMIVKSAYDNGLPLYPAEKRGV
ncbi:MAG: cation:proton antiporter [Alkaliphilus sp.]|nr:monovalent cation/H(+) antiporter subunit G [Alkaliphilus sp. AH-315-G20]MBN4067635.1 monovalent cation/H(+) antiporter subunit G [Alkaliphilus transvaalensis]PHS34882.1 MAG: cation:proton antiporter [Alkaliphilus sp.]